MELARLLKTVAAALLPPIVTAGARRLRAALLHQGSRGSPEWEHVPDSDAVWTATAGWGHGSIAARQAQQWPSFVDSIRPPRVIGISHEAPAHQPADVAVHNTIMSFAYVLGRVSSDKSGATLSVLDWGGGIGHYYRYARELFPEISLDYSIADLPELCDVGAKRNPDVAYYADKARALARSYDLVLASSSLQYARDVHGLTGQLCKAARRYLLVTRMPFVDAHADFVVVQRPHRYGYETEYAGWFLNRAGFINNVEANGFELDREFIVAEQPFVPNAPEQCRYRGFLFKRSEDSALQHAPGVS